MPLVSRHSLVAFTFSRSERRRLEEQYEEVKNEVMELTSETEETTIQKLQDEIKECKAILKCGVCFDRPKEVTYNVLYNFFFLNDLNLFRIMISEFYTLHHSYLRHEVPVSFVSLWLLDNQFCCLN